MAPVLALALLAATPALAQRGSSSGESTGGRRTAEAPVPPAVEPKPTERRDIPEVGREQPTAPATPAATPARGQRDTGRTDRSESGRSESGRAEAGRTPAVVPPADRVPADRVPAALPPRGRRDAPDVRTGSGRGPATGDAPDATRRDAPARGTDSRLGTGPDSRTGSDSRSDSGARRGDTSQGRIDTSPVREGVVSAPRASAASWDRTDWGRDARSDRSGDRYGSDRHRRPAVRIDVSCPWETRFRRGAWSPRYRYRQVVYADIDRWRGRETRYEVVTTYRQRILDASASRARLELVLDDVTLYQDGRYVGKVTRFPYDFERLRATLYRGGRVDFDRDLMVIGDIRDGFEMVSTRAYGGYAYASYRRGDDVRAAFLDFRRQRADLIGRSQFFDPYDRDGYAPISLLPADADWLGDYGAYSASAYPYVGYGYDDRWDGYGYGNGGYDSDDDYYYGGVRERPDATSRGATDGSDRTTRGTYGTNGSPSARDSGRDAGRDTAGRSSTAGEAPTLRRDSDDRYTTPGGGTVRLRRETEMTRVE